MRTRIGNPKQVQRGALQINRAPVDITYDPTVATIYGGATHTCCPPLFSMCTDGTIGIFHTGGESELFLRWIGIRKAIARRQEYAFLQYMGATKQAAGATNLPGVPSAICDPGETPGFGEPCLNIQDCFGLLKICSDPIIDGGQSLPYCERYPRFTIDGVQITNDDMWHEANATEALMADFAYSLIWGVRDNGANKMGHYGLWSILGGFGDARDVTYACPELKPHVLDWGGKPMCSPTAQTGITLDGQALAAQFTLNLYSTIRDYMRGMKRRMRRTGGISGANWAYGDWGFFGPEEAFECLYQCETCFTECNNNYQYMDTERAALRLQELRRMGEGFGGLDIDGYEVPAIPLDPSIITQVGTAAPTIQGRMRNADGTYNFMLLFRGTGNQRLLQPEFNPLNDGSWPTRDNGMTQLYTVTDDICSKLCSRQEWRWYNRAPFANLLIKNVKCDPLISEYLVDTLTAATSTCP